MLDFFSGGAIYMKKAFVPYAAALGALCVIVLVGVYGEAISSLSASWGVFSLDDSVEIVYDTIHDDVDYAVGSAYPLPDPSENVVVAIWGDWGDAILKYSGFPLSSNKGTCPLSPKCSFKQHKSLTSPPPRYVSRLSPPPPPSHSLRDS